MVLESLFELEFDLFVLRDELLLPGEDLATLQALLLQLEQVSRFKAALLRFLLFVNPLGLARVDPIRQEFLGLDIGFDQDCVLV